VRGDHSHDHSHHRSGQSKHHGRCRAILDARLPPLAFGALQLPPVQDLGFIFPSATTTLSDDEVTAQLQVIFCASAVAMREALPVILGTAA
jgi:hypothetical protein